MYAFTNCVLYTGKDVEHDKTLLIDKGLIHSIIPSRDIPEEIERIDLDGLAISPGFIDIQVNGGGGLLFNDIPNVETIKTIVESHRQYGTTDMLPTFITGALQDMQLAAESVQFCLDEDIPGVLGIHFEGPFINSEKIGAHDKVYIQPISEGYLEVVKSIDNGITLLTLAPEMVSESEIEELVNSGILVSLGHSNATYIEAMNAFESGASCVTHLFNAMSSFGSREPGVVGAALDNKDAWVSIIADGFHVDYASIRLAKQAKINDRFPESRKKLFLISDAMPPVGDPHNRDYHLGGHDIQVKDGLCVRKDGTLAGAALDMATAVRNCIQHVGIPKDEALRMASTYPAEFLGLDKKLGLIAPGYKANLAIFDEKIKIKGTVFRGEYQKENI